MVVFLWCFCGGDFLVFLWRCFRGGVVAVVFLWWCSCGGVFVVVLRLCFGGCVVVLLWWCSFFEVIKENPLKIVFKDCH